MDGYGVHAQRWKTTLEQLWAWADEHGDVRALPAGTSHGGVDLRRWVSVRQHEHRRGDLSTDQVSQLERLPGWTWGLSQQERWDALFSVLVSRVETHGSARVPTSVVVDGVRLGAWVSAQRSHHRTRTLSAHRAAALVALPGWTWAPGQ